MKKKLYILGPCSLESLEQMTQVADLLCQLDVTYMRAQLFKPRTNPESFQGLGAEGLSIIEKLKVKYPTLKFVMEVGSLEQLKTVKSHAHIIQVGARNMQNFELLKSIGAEYKNSWDFVLLKRGFANTLSEWLSAARYLELHGIPKNKIILCERGSRSLTSPTGVCMDFISALEAQKLGFLVIADPSHGTKKSEWVVPLAKASLALELDGVMMECHPEPVKSLSDAHQALSLEEVRLFFKNLI